MTPMDGSVPQWNANADKPKKMKHEQEQEHEQQTSRESKEEWSILYENNWNPMTSSIANPTPRQCQ